MFASLLFVRPDCLARLQSAYASTKEEEDRANAKRQEASAAKEAAKTAKAASDYKNWRGGDNSGATN